MGKKAIILITLLICLVVATGIVAGIFLSNGGLIKDAIAMPDTLSEEPAADEPAADEPADESLCETDDEEILDMNTDLSGIKIGLLINKTDVYYAHVAGNFEEYAIKYGMEVIL